MVLKSLLVCADDNAAEILRSILEELDIEGERCCDFVSAAAKLSEARVDAIIVDCDDYKSANPKLPCGSGRRNRSGNCAGSQPRRRATGICDGCEFHLV